jgi:hypothetical protein
MNTIDKFLALLLLPKAHDALQQLFNDWMMNGDRTATTSGGNPKPPPIELYLQWICESWDSLPREAIAKSFKGT